MIRRLWRYKICLCSYFPAQFLGVLAVYFNLYGTITVNLCLVTIKYKNPSCTNITVPQKYVFDFKEYIFPINTFTFHRLEYISCLLEIWIT